MRANLQNAEFIGDKVGSFADWLGVKMDKLPDDYKHLIQEKLAEVEQQITSAQLATYLSDSNYKIIVSNTDNDTFVVQHIRAHKSDLKDNINAAKRLSKNGYSVVVERHQLANGKKNPEFTIVEQDGTSHLSDLKTPDPTQYKMIENGINNGMRSAEGQNLKHVVINIVGDESLESIAAGLDIGFMRNGSIEKVVILKGFKTAEITREYYQSGIIFDQLQAQHLQ